MKAAVLNSAPGHLDIEDVQIDSPGPREVLIETKAAGLCHSDLHFMEGKYPYPLPGRPRPRVGRGGRRGRLRRVTTSSPAITSSPACRPSAVTASSASAATCRCCENKNTELVRPR